MPLLQVRDVPEDIYRKLAQTAKSEHRSIAQQTMVLLKKALDFKQDRVSRRKAVIERIRIAGLGKGKRFTDPAILIREDRDR
jgi:hypothetical protein